MTPLPLPLYVVGGLALGLFALQAFVRFARAGRAGARGHGPLWLVLGVAALAVAIDALLVLVQRSEESALGLPWWVAPALVAALFASRVHQAWRRLGARAPARDEDRPEGFSA